MEDQARMFDLVLAALIAPVSTASPHPLSELKTIASVRATPFCTELREHVAPAIAGILSADEAIDASPKHLATLARDSAIFHDYPRSVFDVMHLESLITPLVRSTKETQHQLDAVHDGQAQPIRSQLQGVLQKQKDALNLISGLVGTFQLGEMTNDLSGPPSEWQGAIAGSERASTATFTPSADSTATALLNASPVAYGQTRMAQYDPSLEGLGHSAFTPFYETMQVTRFNIAAGERDASQLVIAAAAQCRPGAPSTP